MTAVLHAFATFGVGGPQLRALDVWARLGREWQHRVVAMDGRAECAALAPAGVAFELVTPPQGHAVARLRAMRRLLRELRPDLLCTYNWGAIEWLLAARGLRRLRVVHHEDGFRTDELDRRKIRRNIARRLLCRRADRVAVCSRSLERIAQREWSLRAPALRYLPNGVDVERFRPGARRSGGAFTFGCVGGVRPEKDQRLAVRALASCPREVRLVVVGDGPDLAAVRALAAELGVADRVDLRGHVADTAAVYHELDAFLISSRTEQMPIALLEAMASGLPCAGTDVGDVAAMVSEANRPWIVPPGDAGRLAAAMAELAGDPSAAAAAGMANRERAVADFERTRCHGAWAELYREVLAP